MDITSVHLKTALLAYFRFKRQCLCADEVRIGRYLADVLIDTHKGSIEVECKTSKADLFKELKSKKGKHLKYKDLGWNWKPWKFYICVPTELVDDAKKLIQQINNNYGLIEFNTEKFNNRLKFCSKYDWGEFLLFRKHAKPLKSANISNRKKDIIFRLCSAYINSQIDLILNQRNKK